MSQSRWFVIVRNTVLVLVLLVLGFLLARTVAPKLFAPKTEVAQQRAELVQLITSEGPEAAYASFKESRIGNGDSEYHNAAHLFGESLYDVLGLQGIATCDADYNFGCYHGFFTAAVSTEGLGVVQRLDKVCHEVPPDRLGSCQHGLGHGILEYLGHTHLSQALTACLLTDQPDPIAGCTSGVFMEYNVPLIQDDEGTFSVQSRPLLDRTKPYDPCPALDTRFQQSCYHALPQWWFQVYDEHMKVLGELCSQADTRENRYACFSGIGTIIGSGVAYDAEKTALLCEEMPTTETRNLCLFTAAWSAEVNANQHETALALCALLPNEARQRCPK